MSLPIATLIPGIDANSSQGQSCGSILMQYQQRICPGITSSLESSVQLGLSDITFPAKFAPISVANIDEWEFKCSADHTQPMVIKKGDADAVVYYETPTTAGWALIDSHSCARAGFPANFFAVGLVSGQDPIPYNILTNLHVFDSHGFDQGQALREYSGTSFAEVWEDPHNYNYTARSSGSSIAHNDAKLEKLLDTTFNAAANEEFEPGVKSNLTVEIESLVKVYEASVLSKIFDLIEQEKLDSYTVAETLRCLGSIEHPTTHIYRRWILEKCLVELICDTCRDGANLGLAFMDDPHSIPFFEKAMENETSTTIRKLLQQTLDQLKCTANVPIDDTD